MIFLTPTELDSKGLADALVPFERDPVEWLAGWIGGAQRDRAERSNSHASCPGLATATAGGFLEKRRI